jgi:predicted ArsR family transcriptional regulator
MCQVGQYQGPIPFPTHDTCRIGANLAAVAERITTSSAAGGNGRHPTAVVALLAEAVRRDLFQFVRRAGRPVSRDEAAAHAGISRKLAAFHLEKLVSGGLLRAHTDRPAPGVGRRPKVYEPGPVEVAVSVPPQHYDLLAELLLEAVESASGPAGPTQGPPAGAPPGDVVAGTARIIATERGVQAGTGARLATRPGRMGPERVLTAAARTLEAHGYEPARLDPHHLVLRNCPFHRLAASHRDLVCGVNHAFCTGVLTGLGATGSVRAVLEPADGQCCVQLRG